MLSSPGNGAELQLKDLLTAAQAGDMIAGDGLIRLTAKELTMFVSVHVPRLVLVDEVVQDTYLAALDPGATYRGDGSVMAWLKGIARNQIRRALSVRADRSLDAMCLAHVAMDATDGEEAAQDLAQRLDRLSACLEQLPPRGRELVRRHWGEGLSVNRLAQQFKRTASSVASVLARLRAQLRECLAQASIERGI
jgi:RNA polymerase sigma-70 factor (ECF subfamily)